MDRREMTRVLTHAMEGNLEDLRSTGQVQYGHNSIKSYILEVNTPTTEIPFTPSTTLATLPAKIKCELVSTDDSSLFKLVVRKSAKTEAEFFLDVLDNRYWLLHSLASAQEADLAIRDLVLRSMQIDSAWIPTRQFEGWLSNLGSIRAMTARFAAPAGIHNDPINSPPVEDEGLVVKFMGHSSTRSRWQEASKFPSFASQMSLWSANIARVADDLVVRADITSDGKSTARGNSFLLHQELLGAVKNLYRDLIQGFEERHRIGWSQTGSGVMLSGYPAEIQFPDNLSPISFESLLTIMFDCGAPFRLYGTPIWNGGNRYSAQAIDLHTGHPLKIEMDPHLVRVYLSADSCGNVLARLLTNLQRYYDARAELQ